MGDLVERLREGCTNHAFCGGCQDERSDAADEIERLRKREELLIRVAEQLREEVDKSDAIGAGLLVENTGLRKALEKIAVDDPRGPGEFDCIQIARAALHTDASEEGGGE
jgi:hypothetical protein